MIDRASGTLDATLLASLTSGTFTFSSLELLGSQSWDTPAGVQAVLTIENEQILVTTNVALGVATATIVQRGYNGTTAANHNEGTPVQLTVNSAYLKNLESSIVKDDSAILAGLIYQTPVTTITAGVHTVDGDLTSVFTVGRVYLFKVSTTWYRAVVAAAAFGSGTTTLSLVGDSLPSSGTVVQAGFEFGVSVNRAQDLAAMKEIGTAPAVNPPAGFSWIWLRDGVLFTRDEQGAVRQLGDAVSVVSSSSGTLSLNLASSNVFEVTLTENVTAVNPTNAVDGCRYRLRIKQGSGPFAFAFGSAFRFSNSITGYSPSSTAGLYDYVEFVYNAESSKHDIVEVQLGTQASPPGFPPSAALLESPNLIAGTNLAASDMLSLTGVPSTVRRTNVNGTAFAAQSAAVTGSGGVGSTDIGCRSLDLSPTLKVTLSGDNASSPSLKQVKVNPSTGLVTSVTVTSLAVLGASTRWIDMAKVNATTVIAVGSDGSNIRAVVVSSLDGTASVGTAFGVAASANSECSVVYRDDSNVLFFWRNTGNENIAALQAARSGNTLSAGTAFTALSDGTSKVFHCARRFGTSDGIMLVWRVASVGKVAIVTYNAASPGISATGTAANLPDDIRTSANVQAVSMGDTCCAVAYWKGSGTTSSIVTVRRSVVTATVGSALALANNGGEGVSMTAFNQRVVGVQLQYENGGDSESYYVLELDRDESAFIQVFGIQDFADGAVGGRVGGFFWLNPTQAAVLVHGSTTFAAYVVGFTHNYDSFVGAAGAIVAAAGAVKANMGWLQLSGLTTDSRYYLDMGGLLTTQSGGSARLAGRAASLTDILIIPQL